MEYQKLYSQAADVARGGKEQEAAGITALAEEKYSEYLNLVAASGVWRYPQKSKTAYVRCVVEALHYMLLRKGMSEPYVEQVHLALFCELVSMMKQDLTQVFPDDNGVRVCELALQELCHAAVKLVEGSDTMNVGMIHSGGETKVDSDFLLSEVYALVNSTNELLAHCSSEFVELPPPLTLNDTISSDPNDPSLTQVLCLQNACSIYAVYVFFPTHFFNIPPHTLFVFLF